MDGSLDRNQVIDLFGRKEKKKERKKEGKKINVGPTISYPLNIRGKSGGKFLYQSNQEQITHLTIF